MLSIGSAQPRYFIAFPLLLLGLITTGSAYSQEGCITIEEATNTQKLQLTNVCLEGRNLNILVGKHEQQICLLPGESYTLPRKPKEPGEISLTDKGECGQ